MDIYGYIADSNEYGAKAICNKYNIPTQGIQTVEEMAQALEEVVRVNGEAAFKEIAALHPDKDVIVELFGTSTGNSNFSATAEACNCKKESAVEKYVQEASGTHGVNLQNGLLAFGFVAVICVVAIVANKH